MRNRRGVPRLWAWLLGVVAPPERRDAQLGDLEEEHVERAEQDMRAADRWYRRQVVLSLAPNLRRRARAAHRAHGRGRGGASMSTLLQDLRMAVRSARSDLPFTSVVVLVLGLGIGATTTIFSVVHGLILDPFPFPEPDRIVGVGTAYPRLGAELGFWENLSTHEYLDVRDNATTLEDVVAWDMGNRQIDTEGSPENVFSAFWWGDPLTTVGMDAHLGRGFTADELRTGANVVMIGEDAWITRFGADSSMVGGTLSVNGSPHTLVGIFPSGVDIYGTDLWMIMPVAPEEIPRNRRQFQILARIREGSTLEDVNAELAVIAARVAQDHGAELPEYEGWSMRALRWGDVVSRTFRLGAFVLLGAVAFVLLLVCANVASLLLSRAQARRQEMAVRTALGAGRGRLVVQLLAESVTLALLGAAVGVALARLGTAGISYFLALVALPIAGTVEVNGPVLAFTASVAVTAGVLFGIAPALRASRTGISDALQAEGKGSTAGRNRQRLQRTLVGVEVALAFVLLAGGGLLVNSFVRVSRVGPGVAAEEVLTMRLTLPREEYSAPRVVTFFRELSERLEALPGVRSAAAGTQYPPVAFSYRQVFFEGPEADAEATLPTALATVVTRGYFETLGIPVLRGRAFEERDAEDTPFVAVVNEEVARRFFPGEDPIGRRMKLDGADAATSWFEIVGVVGATRNVGLDRDPFPEIFALHDQTGGNANQLFLLLRTDVEPASLLPSVRATVLAMDADQPIYLIRTIEESLHQEILPMRAATLMLAIFAAFALAIAAVGVYSVVSFTVSQRTREIGLRVALGADGAGVRRLVVRQALLPVLAGALAGGAGAFVLGGALQGILFEVGGRDPLTLGAIALILVTVAAAASWIPAWRAARLDPVEALRLD